MKIWMVTTPKGTLYVQAATKAEALTKAQASSGQTSNVYVQGTVSKVPQGYTLITGATAPIPTTPTPTTPTGTTPTTTGATASASSQLAEASQRLQQTLGGISAEGQRVKTELETAGYLSPEIKEAVGLRTEGKYSKAQIDDYLAYLLWRKTEAGQAWPAPKNIGDYLSNIDTWAQQGKTAETDQTRAFNDYKQWYYSYGQPGDWMPTSLEDFIANQDAANQQMTVFKQRQAEGQQAQQTAEEKAAYQAKEAYGEAPMFQETFAKWIGGQGDVSEALRGFIEQQYPSLRAEYEAGLPRLTGFPTREEARAEATKRETGFAGWLEGMTPELEQEYYMQRPYQRGERLTEYSPSLRAVNW